MRTWILAALLVVSMVGVGVTAVLTTGSADSVEAPVVSVTPEPASEMASLFFAEAYFTGTWCHISCADGSFESVRTLSTSGCCGACASFCGTLCTANGTSTDPAVLCESTF